MGQNVAEEAHAVSDAVQKLLSTMKEINVSNQELAEMAEEMQSAASELHP